MGEVFSRLEKTCTFVFPLSRRDIWTGNCALLLLYFPIARSGNEICNSICHSGRRCFERRAEVRIRRYTCIPITFCSAAMFADPTNNSVAVYICTIVGAKYLILLVSLLRDRYV